MLALALTALAAASPAPVTISGGAWYSHGGDVLHSRLVARDRRSGRRFVLARRQSAGSRRCACSASGRAPMRRSTR